MRNPVADDAPAATQRGVTLIETLVALVVVALATVQALQLTTSSINALGAVSYQLRAVAIAAAAQELAAAGHGNPTWVKAELEQLSARAEQALPNGRLQLSADVSVPGCDPCPMEVAVSWQVAATHPTAFKLIRINTGTLDATS